MAGARDVLARLSADEALVNAVAHDGATPLHRAVFAPRFPAPLLAPLVRGQRDINARNIEGETALHLATHSPEVVELLLAAGADPNARDQRGATPLHRAAVVWLGLAEASRGPSPGLPPRYVEPTPMYHGLLYDLTFDGGCPADLPPPQVLLEFEIDREGTVVSVRPRGPAPDDDALDSLLQAALEFRFEQKFVEWESQPFTTVMALPLPSRGCLRPASGSD